MLHSSNFLHKNSEPRHELTLHTVNHFLSQVLCVLKMPLLQQNSNFRVELFIKTTQDLSKLWVALRNEVVRKETRVQLKFFSGSMQHEPRKAA